jgi:hypothetical protein
MYSEDCGKPCHQRGWQQWSPANETNKRDDHFRHSNREHQVAGFDPEDRVCHPQQLHVPE